VPLLCSRERASRPQAERKPIKYYLSIGKYGENIQFEKLQTASYFKEMYNKPPHK